MSSLDIILPHFYRLVCPNLHIKTSIDILQNRGFVNSFCDIFLHDIYIYLYRNDMTVKFQFVFQISTAPKPPLCKGRWIAVRRDGGIDAVERLEFALDFGKFVEFARTIPQSKIK